MNRTVLFTPASNVLAHVGRCITLARALSARGWRIAFGGEPHFLGDRRITGDLDFELHPLPDIPVERVKTALRELHTRIDLRHLRDSLEAERDLIGRLRPDVVVNDFRLTAYLSAAIQGVPVAALLNGRWLVQFASEDYRRLRTHPGASRLQALLGDRIGGALVRRLVLAAWDHKYRPYKLLYRQHGMTAPPHLWNMLLGDLGLVLDIESIAPLDNLPPHVVRVGPVPYSVPVSSSESRWRSAEPRRRPLLYATLGSTGDPDLFRTIIEVLGELDLDVVLTTGGQVHYTRRELPTNVEVETYVSGTELIPQADLVVFHGGSGTAYQVIAAARPAVVVATHVDQELNADALEAAGCAVFLTMTEVLRSPERLSAAVMTILRDPDPYRRAAAALRDEHLRYDPINDACAAIETLVTPR